MVHVGDPGARAGRSARRILVAAGAIALRVVIAAAAVLVLAVFGLWFLAAPNLSPSIDTIAPSEMPKAGAVDEVLAALTPGFAAFNTPERARLGEPLVIEARVSGRLPPEALRALVGEAGRVESAPLRLSPRMSATLNGGTAFDIQPSGPQEQWVSEQSGAVWTWAVTPKRDGEQVLILSFDAFITVAGKEGRASIGVLKRRIAVDVDPLRRIASWLDVAKEIGGNAYWFLTVLVIPAGFYLWRRVRRRAAEPPRDIGM
jgi:hypothetical protein